MWVCWVIFYALCAMFISLLMVLCLYNNIVLMRKKWGCVWICVWLYVCGMWDVHTIPIYKPVAGGVFYVYSLYVVTKTDSKRIVRLPLLFFYKNAMGRDRKLFYYNYVVPCGYIYYPHQSYITWKGQPSPQCESRMWLFGYQSIKGVLVAPYKVRPYKGYNSDFGYNPNR